MGEAYPGSRGGEIFNYYGTDANANTASGDYSTTIGIGNKNSGYHTFVGGDSNVSTSNNAFVFGHANTLTSSSLENFILGGSNSTVPRASTQPREQIIIGNDNKCTYALRGTRMFGKGLQDDLNAKVQTTYLGCWNAPMDNIANTERTYGIVVGAGSTTTARRNALEIFSDGLNAGKLNLVHIPSPFYFSLNNHSNGAFVNQITDPLSNPASTDDKTLATKAYVDSHILGITVPRADVLLTGQSTTVSNGGSISLETDLSLTLPTWTKQLRLGIHNSGGYVEYLLIDNVSAHSYVSVTGAGTVDVYSYDPTTTTFTFVSGGTSMSIVSVRAEGTASI